MFSDVLKAALEKEIAGQPAAVASAVRGTTRVMSGLTPRERSWCAYMFMGPSGTGKSQLVRSLAQILHGENRGLFIADCTHFVHSDPWTAFAVQFAPMFSQPRADDGSVLAAPPLSVLLIEYLERGRKEISKALTAALDTGRLALPGGRLGSLRQCLIFITTSLCSRQILEENLRIGFQGAGGAGLEEDRVSKACRDAAEEQFGEDLINRLDALVVFHRLQEEHIGEICDRRFERMNRWIGERGLRCEMRPAARSFLLDRSSGDTRLGARELARVFRRYLEFPVADLMISRRIPPGGLVIIDHVPGEAHLHFTVTCASPGLAEAAETTSAFEVAVQ